MDFAQQQRNPAKHLAGLSIVIVCHILAVYALVTGLAQKAVQIVRGPLETKLIEEIKKLPPDTPPPPPPKLAPPPPPFIPPPEVNIAMPAAPAANTITQVTTQRPVTPPPAPVARSVHVPPVIDAKQSCPKPEYPSSSRRLEEEGTVVLNFLIDVDGRVLDSKVASSSGSGRLDEAARAALGRCRFKAGMTDGKPEQSWASIKYTWKLQ